jgi:hypothetical protein
MIRWIEKTFCTGVFSVYTDGTSTRFARMSCMYTLGGVSEFASKVGKAGSILAPALFVLNLPVALARAPGKMAIRQRL